MHAKRARGAEKLPSTINTCWHNFIFYFMSAIFFHFFGPVLQAYHFAIVRLHLSSTSLPLVTMEKGTRKPYKWPYLLIFKKKKERKSAATAHTHTRPSYSTCSTFTTSSETDSIYIISRTHNNSQLQPALLHEYMEGRVPATLFHDWTPKDRSGVGWKGKGKWWARRQCWMRCGGKMQR